MALTKVTGDFIETGSITQGHLHSSHGITLDHIGDGSTNTFFTTANARAAISATGSLSYNNSTGVMSFTMPTLNTTNITEGDKLFFTNARAIGALTAGTNITISGSTISSTDTNTTYSVGDGGLTQNNFTNTLKTKLHGIAASANNYSLPFTNNSANWNTAYGWGNHASAGYLTSHQSLSGYLPLSGGTMTGDISLASHGRLAYSTTHWISPRDSSGNMHLRTSSGGIYLDSPVIYLREQGSEGNKITIDNETITATGTITGSNLSGTNTGDQTNITGNAATATTASGQTSGSHFSLNNGGGGYGLVGVYNPDIHQGLFAMGSSYMLTASGGLGNFYGVSWSYDYSGRQLNTGSNLQHCLAVANAGTVATVIGLGIWTSGIITTTSDMRAPIFYDSNDTNYYIDANSTSRLNIIQGTEIYSHSWLRNHNANTGLYNQATATHWYSDAQGYFNIGGGVGGQGIKLRHNHASTVRGILYYDTSSNFGFLNSGSSWRIKCVGGDHVEFDGTSARAKIFYDQNNTTYYTDPASTSNLYNLNLTGAKHTYLEISPGNGHEAMVRFNGGSGSTWYVGSRTTTQTIGSTDAFHVYSQTAAKTVGGWDTGGNLFTTNSLRLTDSDSYIMGGSITSRAAVRAIDVGYASSSCFISASRTGSNPSMIMMGGSSNQNYIYNRQSGSNTTGRTMYCVVGTTTAFYVHGASGQVNFFGGTVGHSDRLSKRNIEDSSYGLDAVNNLRPRRFFWKNEIRSKEKQIGFIAQEVEEVLPEAVRGYEGDKGILDNALISVLTKAVQELSQQVTDLKAEVELLKQ